MSKPEPKKQSGEYCASDPKDWVETHGDVLFGFALKYVSNRAVAEDLVQETFLAALKARSSFAGSSSEQTWLIGILKNKIMDYFRKSNRETSLEEPDQVSDPDNLDYIGTGPIAGTWSPQRRPQAWSVDTNDPVEQQQFWEHLQHCMEGLDHRLSKVYTLREIQEVEYARAATSPPPSCRCGTCRRRSAN